VLPKGPSSASLASLEPQEDANGPVCISARNYMNTQYTVSMQVAGRSFWMVPDSGSFEVLVPSSACQQCACASPTAKNVFPEAELAATLNASRRVDVTFGQGKVSTRTVNAAVKLGALTTRAQSLLLLEEVHLSHYCDSSYDGVMGLGFRRRARDDDGELSLLSSMRVANFSMCFGRFDADPGRLILGSGIPGMRYDDVPVVGQRHWAVQLTGAGFGSSSVCSAPPYCAAIVDSGTSLLAGPKALVYSMIDGLQQQLQEDCSNVDQLPDLKFTVGPPEASVTLSLSPEFYVLRTTDATPSDDAAGKRSEKCSLMFMDLDMQDHNYGPVWILGAPFMRAYSTRFSRGVAPDATADSLQNRRLGFSRIAEEANPCAGCPHAAGARAADQQADAERVLPPVSMQHTRMAMWAQAAVGRGQPADIL